MRTESTRDALVRAGTELLEETQSSDLGLREIARRAGVSHGAPRRWFPTHQSLLAAIADVGLRDLAHELTSATEQSNEALRAMATAYVGFAVRRPAMFTLIFRHDLLEGSGVNLRGLSQPMFDGIVTIIRDSTDTTDPVGTGAALWAGIHGIAVLASTGALNAAAPTADVGHTVDLLVDGMLVHR